LRLEEIAVNDYNLNIPRYVEPKPKQEMLSIEEAMNRLKERAYAAIAAEDRLLKLFEQEALLTRKE
jgi:type I restriction enzyme M protein